MNGSLALVGSGEYLPAMAQFEKSLIDDGVKNGKQAIYIQIPTAAGRESEDRLNFWRELGKTQADSLNIKSIYLPIYTRDDAHNPKYIEQIKNSALIYMSGGDPHYLAETLIGTPLWDAIYENWQSGGSLAGCSAGAMVLSAQIPNFRFSKKEPTVGLNLIPNIRVIPHFNKFFKWIPESAAKILLHVPRQHNPDWC
jgi:cyanophycinase